MDEGFEALTLMQTGKARMFPVVLVDKPGGTYWDTWLQFLKSHLLHQGLISPEDFNFIHDATSVDDAIEYITKFYSNYHSYRWLGSRIIIRMQRALTEEQREKLDNDFTDVLASGKFEQYAHPLPEENAEPDTVSLHRLVFQPHKRRFGRLRQVFDAVNQ
jgi:hypothetical protein